MQVSFKVNGKLYRAEAEPRTLLVHFLREDLGLVGTNIGCDSSQCGSCTVIYNDAAVKSCTMLAVQAQDGEVRTVEGLAQNYNLNALQEGFWEKHGLQCGFCTPGMLMTLTDLLEHNPTPNEEQIRHAMEGTYCRCTGYQNIVRAVEYAAQKLTKAASQPETSVAAG
jgi:carbon-monoxide dehydrogenase small subunit